LRIPLAIVSRFKAELTINLKGDLDLGHTAGRWGHIGQVKLAEHVVVLGHGPLALKDLNSDGGLVVDGGGEDLRLLGGDDRVAANELGHDTAGGLDTEGKGANVDEEQALAALLAGKNTTLDGSTVGDSLVGVDTLGRLLAVKVLLEELLDLGDTGGTTNENDLISVVQCKTHIVNFVLLDTGIFHDLLDRLHGATEKVDVELFEFGPS
jgi:hypothetical protein